jgi:hypothetical protein
MLQCLYTSHFNKSDQQIPNSLYYIKAVTYFGSQRAIFKDSHELQREVYITAYMKYSAKFYNIVNTGDF